MTSSMTLQGVSAFYDGKCALENVSFTVPEKQITAIIGPSGCGKSTLLCCMNGLLAEDAAGKSTGTILLGETDISTLPKEELRRRVGLVLQTPSPFPMSIYRNMTYAPKYYGKKDRNALDALAKEKLQMAALYEEVKNELDKSALKLSGGQQQRLCIARALTVEPELLLLDEPCSALDVKSSAAIEALLTELKKQYTIVIVTHNLAQARRISDQAVFLFNGRMIECAPTEQLFRAPQQEETKSFLSGIFG